MIKGLAAIYDQLFPFEEQTRVFYLRELGTVDGGEELRPLAVDVGCGTGALLALAAERGWRGLGIDPDTDMILAARTRLGRTGMVEFRKATMQEKLPTGIADRLFCTGNTLSFCQNLHEVRAVLESFRATLREEGRLVIQVVNWDRIDPRSAYEFPVLSVLHGGVEYTFHRRYIPLVSGQKMLFETELRTASSRHRETAEMAMIPADSLRRIAGEIHFGDIQLLGSFNGERWTPQSPLTILAANRM